MTTTETLGPPSADLDLARISMAQELDVVSLQAERDVFAGRLVDARLMSQEFADSGALDYFLLDSTNGYDSVRHILVGDSTGGCHHLRSVVDLELEGRTIASEIYDPNRPERKPSSFVKEQRVKEPEGIYGVNVVGIEEDGHTYWKQAIRSHNGEDMAVHNGSSMFPDEWSAEDVLRSILEVAALPANPDTEAGIRPVTIHDGRANGVRIKVVVDNTTGKIITASPVVPKR